MQLIFHKTYLWEEEEGVLIKLKLLFFTSAKNDHLNPEVLSWVYGLLGSLQWVYTLKTSAEYILYYLYVENK